MLSTILLRFPSQSRTHWFRLQHANVRSRPKRESAYEYSDSTAISLPTHLQALEAVTGVIWNWKPRYGKVVAAMAELSEWDRWGGTQLPCAVSGSGSTTRSLGTHRETLQPTAVAICKPQISYDAKGKSLRIPLYRKTTFCCSAIAVERDCRGTLLPCSPPSDTLTQSL